MRHWLFKSKIQRAQITRAGEDDEGSVTIDATLMDAADIVPHEYVHIWDLNRDARLAAYAVPGARGSGVVSVNGKAAQVVLPGDLVNIATFVDLDDDEARRHRPRVVLVDERNRIRQAR
jgi:aspartate 1-decarboxylase